MNNYVVYHLHSDLSNAYTTMDSVTKYKMYIAKAQELGMTAMGFSEHGSILEWYHKKEDIENAGMKYIHGCEVYVTKTLTEKIRDNRHCILIAKNFDGFKELNTIVSKSFNRQDGHYYYSPRITLDELLNTSDNIIITTACLGGILNSKDLEFKRKFLSFLTQNKERCFLEIQHHNIADQIQYNKLLYSVSQKTGLRLIAGTDTHSIDEKYADGRVILQRAKNIYFQDEDGWDLTFKTYDELVSAYKQQNALPENVFLNAINNTNVLANMIEPFKLDMSFKYPKLYDNPDKVFTDKIVNGLKNNKYVNRHNKDDVVRRVKEEIDVYKKVGSIDFMLLQDYEREWEHQNGIYCGYSRGSVSGSYVAYLLGITEMDSLKFNLNFFRFMNPSRVSLGDIDSDYSNEDRDRVKYFILNDHMNLPTLRSSEIITFNTIQLKGAIRDIGRALNIPLDEVGLICDGIEDNEDERRKEYPELFKYVDLLNGVIVSVGSHPSGVLVTDRNIEEMIGTCSLATSDYPVSQLNMKELDAQMYVKLDILGLDAVGIINETCKLAGIDRLTPDNCDLNDNNVWNDIIDDSTSIFQWESNSARAFLKNFMSKETLDKVKKINPNFNMIKWLSFGNGLIRPACASYRDEVAQGIPYDNGIEELNEFLAQSLGHVTMQEDIMQFLVRFCGYSDGESDTVRRGIAKKKGTEQLIPEIEKRFVDYTSKHYGVSKEKCQEVIKPFLSVILDASAYAFSWNHSDSYSIIGYIMGYLRYYYPLEYLCTFLNIKRNNMDDVTNITSYAKSKGINIKNIRFGYSKADYFVDKKTNSIYQGLEAIKYLNKDVGNNLYELSKQKQYQSFAELYKDIKEQGLTDTRQIKILIKLNYFIDFGKNKKLLEFVNIYNDFYEKKQFSYNKQYCVDLETIKLFCRKETDKMCKEFDFDAFIEYIWNNIEDCSINLKEQIQTEIEMTGNAITTIDSVDNDVYIVSEFMTYKEITKPYLTLRRISDGDEIKCRVVDKRVFSENSFTLYNILRVYEMRVKPKTIKLPDGSYGKSETETEQVLAVWEVLG